MNPSYDPSRPDRVSGWPRRGFGAVLLAALSLSLAILLGGCNDSPTEPCMGPLQVSGEVTRPEKVFAPQPQYTDLARTNRTQGVVILQATIDCRGNVTDVRVLKSLPDGLTESAVAAISRWRFEPARLNGQPVSVYYNLTVNFRLA